MPLTSLRTRELRREKTSIPTWYIWRIGQKVIALEVEEGRRYSRFYQLGSRVEANGEGEIPKGTVGYIVAIRDPLNLLFRTDDVLSVLFPDLRSVLREVRPEELRRTPDMRIKHGSPPW